MQLALAPLLFPKTFCCNCGERKCLNQIQETKRTRYFGVGGTETTINFPIPVCASCIRTTRRIAPSWFHKLLVTATLTCIVFLFLIFSASHIPFPALMAESLFKSSVILSVVICVALYALRRPKPPQTSYYQPVRIHALDYSVHVGFSSGSGEVAQITLGFTNEQYLRVFREANKEAISVGYLSVIKI